MPDTLVWWKPWTWHLVMYPWYDRAPTTVDDLALYMAVYLNRCGVRSIRAARRLIAEGHVTLDGERVTDPTQKVGRYDDFEVWVADRIRYTLRHEGGYVNIEIVEYAKPMGASRLGTTRGEGEPS